MEKTAFDWTVMPFSAVFKIQCGLTYTGYHWCTSENASLVWQKSQKLQISGVLVKLQQRQETYFWKYRHISLYCWICSDVLVDAAIYLTKLEIFRLSVACKVIWKSLQLFFPTATLGVVQNGNIAQVSAANYGSARDTKIIQELLNVSCEVSSKVLCFSHCWRKSMIFSV